eukprot:43213-Eustigmatos_ZCMA.PRE.1
MALLWAHLEAVWDHDGQKIGDSMDSTPYRRLSTYATTGADAGLPLPGASGSLGVMSSIVIDTEPPRMMA